MFNSNDTKSAWLGMKMAAGIKSEKREIYVTNEAQYANDLNAFYCRFDKHDFSHVVNSLKKQLRDNDDKIVEIEAKDVCQVFRHINGYKATGPDKVSGNTLKHCASELSTIFAYLFNASLRLSLIPNNWKTAEVIPVPKKPTFVHMNDLRPVALTPIAMKCFEKIMLNFLKKEVEKYLDPFQFAYKAKCSVEDAVLVFVNKALKHLERPQTYVRVLFIDFSSAFNTIQPHIMVEKLLGLNVNKNLIAWILDFLIQRKQYVKLNNTISSICELNTGALQGCVLSPTLYTLYTNDYRAHKTGTTLIKFADDSAIIGLFTMPHTTSYIEEIQSFVDWCDKNYLELNVSKTKELIIDFRHREEEHQPLKIKNEFGEIVDHYKYLGFIVDNKLNWHEHVATLCRKLNQRMYFLRELNSFDINVIILKRFYISIIESIIMFGISCWGGAVTTGDQNKINSVIKRAERIIGCEFDHVDKIFSKACLRKLQSILGNDNHPLSGEFRRSGRSNRILQPASRTERYKNSFVPSSVKLLRSSLSRI